MEQKCPFCENHATVKNKQHLPVCEKHLKLQFPDVKCKCGSYLDLQEGKWGVYFRCMKCGSINLKKVLDMLAARGEKIISTAKVSNAGKVSDTERVSDAEHQVARIKTAHNNEPNKSPNKDIIITPNDVEWFS